MNKQKLTSVVVLAAMVMLAVAGCGSKESRRAAALAWDGSHITGTPFYERRMETVTVHYTPPTTPEKVELLGTLTNRLLTGYKGWGRFTPSERVDIWVLPAGTATVEGFHWLLENQRAQAVKPNVVILREEAMPASELDMPVLQLNSLPEALAVAVTQPESSPVYNVPWLHEGMGSLFVSGWSNFPAVVYARNSFMFIQRSQKVWTSQEILDRLNNPSVPPPKVMKGPLPPGYRQAAAALSGLVVDRWGVDWPEVYPRTAEQLTPAEALKWVMGVTDDQKAMDLFDDRMEAAVEELYLIASGRAGGQIPPTMAMRGLNRIHPQPIAGKGNGPGVMPTYVVNVDLDPISLTMSGEEQVTWVNNRTAAVDRLYFTVWGNNELARRNGGESTVESVTVDGNPLAFSLNRLDLEVPLETPVQPGASVKVQLKFQTRIDQVGFIPPRPGQLPLSDATPARNNVGIGISTFYPMLAVLDEKGWQMASYPSGLYADPAKHVVRIRVPQGTEIAQPSPDPKKPLPPVVGVADGNKTLFEFELEVATSWRGYIVPKQKSK